MKSQLSLISLYRFDLFTRWFMNLFSIAAYYYLWLLTSPSPAESAKLLSYYVLYWGFVNNLTSSKVANFMNRDIHSGEINNYLTKPINYPVTVIIRSLVPIFVRIVMPSILIFLSIIFLGETMRPSSLIGFIFFIFFSLAGFLIQSLLMVTLGSISFWGMEVRSLSTVVDLCFNLLRGAYIPAFLFPPVVTKLLSFTFIPLMGSFPIKIYQETVSLQTLIFEISIAIFWFIALFLLAKKTYHSGLKLYEAQGG